MHEMNNMETLFNQFDRCYCVGHHVDTAIYSGSIDRQYQLQIFRTAKGYRQSLRRVRTDGGLEPCSETLPFSAALGIALAIDPGPRRK